MKRIASIQDLSSLGKCSQTVALPILSVMGLECVPIPTALLSAHTAFEGFISRDLTDSAEAALAHFLRLGLTFDTIYSGYLGSAAQVALAERFLTEFPAAHRLVDPAMGDNGQLYAGLSPELPGLMRRLCRHADIITPNLTEASLLTGLPQDSPLSTLLERLLELGVKHAVITGLRPDEAHVAVACMGTDGKLLLHQADYVPSVFHGTGDLFASVTAGAVTLGLSPEKAVALAADYVTQTVALTARTPDAPWYGVEFERTLPLLWKRLSEEETLCH